MDFCFLNSIHFLMLLNLFWELGSKVLVALPKKIFAGVPKPPGISMPFRRKTILWGFMLGSFFMSFFTSWMLLSTCLMDFKVVGGGEHVLDPVGVCEVLEGASLEAEAPITLDDIGEPEHEQPSLQDLCHSGHPF